jgi:hypothetical protein
LGEYDNIGEGCVKAGCGAGKKFLSGRIFQMGTQKVPIRKNFPDGDSKSSYPEEFSRCFFSYFPSTLEARSSIIFRSFLADAILAA